MVVPPLEVITPRFVIFLFRDYLMLLDAIVLEHLVIDEITNRSEQLQVFQADFIFAYCIARHSTPLPAEVFRTGDLASVDKRGRYSIKGRMGSVIIGPSGENIYPEEIESVINNINDISESLVVERNGHLVALVHFNDNVLDWNYESQDRFVEELDRRKEEILKFVNERVNRSSRISDVEVEKEPFIKTATLKIKRFLYKEKKEN